MASYEKHCKESIDEFGEPLRRSTNGLMNLPGRRNTDSGIDAKGTTRRAFRPLLNSLGKGPERPRESTLSPI